MSHIVYVTVKDERGAIVESVSVSELLHTALSLLRKVTATPEFVQGVDDELPRAVLEAALDIVEAKKKAA